MENSKKVDGERKETYDVGRTDVSVKRATDIDERGLIGSVDYGRYGR